MTSSSLRDTESSSRSLLDKELNAPKNLFGCEVIQKIVQTPGLSKLVLPSSNDISLEWEQK